VTAEQCWRSPLGNRGESNLATNKLEFVGKNTSKMSFPIFMSFTSSGTLAERSTMSYLKIEFLGEKLTYLTFLSFNWKRTSLIRPAGNLLERLANSESVSWNGKPDFYR
jgi:hypothetical protein